jgi:hypothetical protein
MAMLPDSRDLTPYCRGCLCNTALDEPFLKVRQDDGDHVDRRRCASFRYRMARDWFMAALNVPQPEREGRCTASGTRVEFALAAFVHQTRLINLQRCPQRSPDATQRAAVRCRAGVHRATVDLGPGSRSNVKDVAPRPGHEQNVVSPHFLHQTRLTNLRRCHSVPRTQRSAQWCAAEPGSIVLLSIWVPALGAT